MKSSMYVVFCLLIAVFVALPLGQEAGAVALAREKRTTLTKEAENLIRQSEGVDKNNVGQLIDLVEKTGADECMTRVICELTQNGRAHGDAGVKFGQSLLKFRQSKHPLVKKYTDAMSVGAKAKNAEQCKEQYSRCSHSTVEVITVGNKILNHSA